MNPADYWHGMDCGWWLLARDGDCHAVSSDLAALWADAGEFTVMLGSYAEAKAAALARQQPEPVPAEKPKRPRKPRVKKQPAAVPETLFEHAA